VCHAGRQASEAHVPHLAAGDRRGHVCAVAVFVSGGHVLVLEHLGIDDAAGVPPCTDDLSVAARGVELRAGLTYSLPPCRHRAISAVVKAPRFRPYACSPLLTVSDQMLVIFQTTKLVQLHTLVDTEARIMKYIPF
jgi:hypothetical protein